MPTIDEQTRDVASPPGSAEPRTLAELNAVIGRFRGPADFDGRAGYITVHPSYLLRLPGKEARALGF